MITFVFVFISCTLLGSIAYLDTFVKHRSYWDVLEGFVNKDEYMHIHLYFLTWLLILAWTIWQDYRVYKNKRKG